MVTCSREFFREGTEDPESDIMSSSENNALSSSLAALEAIKIFQITPRISTGTILITSIKTYAKVYVPTPVKIYCSTEVDWLFGVNCIVYVSYAIIYLDE